MRDKNTNDCRGGVQYSKIQGDYTQSVGTQVRILDNSIQPMINFDVYTGWQWALSSNLRIGFETILRREETKNPRYFEYKQKPHRIRTDFNWLAGVQYRF